MATKLESVIIELIFHGGVAMKITADSSIKPTPKC